RRPGLRLREDARAQPDGPPRARRAARAGPPDPARHLAQVDARAGPRPAGRRAARGHPSQHSERDRQWRRHRTRPRRPRERAGGADERRHHPWLARYGSEGATAMTDRIMLQNLRFEAPHGYYDYEQRIPQPFEVDVELRLNLQ